MINPGTMMKIMDAKNKFTENHPRFVAFLSMIFSRGITEGTIIEVQIKRPDGKEYTSNLKIAKEDMELFQKLKETK